MLPGAQAEVGSGPCGCPADDSAAPSIASANAATGSGAQAATMDIVAVQGGEAGAEPAATVRPTHGRPPNQGAQASPLLRQPDPRSPAPAACRLRGGGGGGAFCRQTFAPVSECLIIIIRIRAAQTYKAVPLLCCTKRLFTHVSCHRSMHTYPLQPDVPVSLLFFTARVLLRSRNDAQSIYTFRLRKRKCHSGRVCCQGHFIQPGRWLLVGAFRYVWEGRGRRTTRGGRCNPHKYTRHLTQTFLPTHCRNTATKGRSPWTSSPSSRPRSWTCASRPSGASTRTVRTGAFMD